MLLTSRIMPVVVLLALSIIGYSQPTPADCNPKLSPEEIQFFKNSLNSSFDFAGKNIGFAFRNNKHLGFANSFLPTSKKEYFNFLKNDTKGRLQSKLLVLDSAQKKESKGFDAIVLVYEKKNHAKAEQANYSRLTTTFGYRPLNYPDNLDAVGNDSNQKLSPDDVIFFNKIFQHKINSFDFTNKKIAFVNTNEHDKSKQVKTKQEYIRGVKTHLEKDFLFPAYDNVHILTETEKKETGGYDAIIIYQCKGCELQQAINIVKQGGT